MVIKDGIRSLKQLKGKSAVVQVASSRKSVQSRNAS